MAIITLGLNHQTAPISVRERLAVPQDFVVNTLRRLRDLQGVEEAAILSTCNRTEFYCGVSDRSPESLVDWIAREQRVNREDFQHYLYTHTDSSTIRHMFRVASGLDSMVLGEPQILGQMKSAYQIATEAGTIGKTLGKP
ncbi:MAG: glutamyl-tRNA reductase, partial [Gammaproteobacteria bacterium]|nr:glutamyl-tRNA reductase [Gammaproteobacteria bacterium]